MLLFAIIMIGTGIAADNLAIAGISSKDFRHSPKWFVLLPALFLVQDEMLVWGRYFGRWTLPLTGRHPEWPALGLLVSLSVYSCKEQYHRKPLSPGAYSSGNILALGFGTAMYVFVFAVAMQWLGATDYRVNLFLSVTILLFLVLGLLPGKLRGCRLIPQLQKAFTGLLMAGVAILIYNTI